MSLGEGIPAWGDSPARAGEDGTRDSCCPRPSWQPQDSPAQGGHSRPPTRCFGTRGGGIHRRQFGRSHRRPPAPHLGSPVPPQSREMPRRTHLFLPPRAGTEMLPDYFCGSRWLQIGVSSPFFHTGQLRLSGRVGMQQQRNPSVEPTMKYSGPSVQFPPHRRKHHEYCRWALKFHGCHASPQPRGHHYCGKALRQDTSGLRQAPATRFPLVYPQNRWW